MLPRSILLLLPAWLGFVLMACGTIEPNKIAEKIKEDLNKQGGVTVKTVKCPEEVNPKSGESFDCRAEIDVTKSFPIRVKLKDNRGNVDWEVLNTKVILNLKGLESQFKEALKTQAGTDVDVKCGTTPYRLNKPGDSFECTMMKQGKPGVILVKLDPEGNVNWNEVIEIPVAKAPELGKQVGGDQKAGGKTGDKNAAQSSPSGTAATASPSGGSPTASPSATASPTTENIVNPGNELPDVTND
ncbi:DUF4333 domain-containing protein [Leptolyngbya sp. 'hensonii']|uniref:DUF4333 domain-containing protein n=1 Tax=Leptolyngbya sp. 'hensonii' TaxID=1922337 RepID=UPI0015598A43|nr:DUF4333 domain-containing protein [Leptolyngbya sp. 'hensonii']